MCCDKDKAFVFLPLSVCCNTAHAFVFLQCVVTQPKPWCCCWCQCVVTVHNPLCSCWCQCVVTHSKPCCFAGVNCCDTYSPSLGVLLVSSVRPKPGCFAGVKCTAQAWVFCWCQMYGPSRGERCTEDCTSDSRRRATKDHSLTKGYILHHSRSKRKWSQHGCNEEVCRECMYSFALQGYISMKPIPKTFKFVPDFSFLYSQDWTLLGNTHQR